LVRVGRSKQKIGGLLGLKREHIRWISFPYEIYEDVLQYVAYEVAFGDMCPHHGQGEAPSWRGANFREALRQAVAPKRGPPAFAFVARLNKP